MPDLKDKTTSDPPPPPRGIPADIAAALAKAPGNLTPAERDALLLAIAKAVLHL